MDIEVHYLEAGQDFPLARLHGSGEDRGCFEHRWAPSPGITGSSPRTPGAAGRRPERLNSLALEFLEKD